jgi:hypothetical protein
MNTKAMMPPKATITAHSRSTRRGDTVAELTRTQNPVDPRESLEDFEFAANASQVVEDGGVDIDDGMLLKYLTRCTIYRMSDRRLNRICRTCQL